MNKVDAGWKIESVQLTLRAKVPGIDDAKFQEPANNAKNGCPISNVLNAAQLNS